MTNMSVADDSIQLELTDERLFQYPFLFLQQPGRGFWNPTTKEAAALREHLLRGGFLLIDDLHSEYDWSILQNALNTVFPDREIVEIPESDPIMHSFFDLIEPSRFQVIATFATADKFRWRDRRTGAESTTIAAI